MLFGFGPSALQSIGMFCRGDILSGGWREWTAEVVALAEADVTGNVPATMPFAAIWALRRRL